MNQDSNQHQFNMNKGSAEVEEKIEEVMRNLKIIVEYQPVPKTKQTEEKIEEEVIRNLKIIVEYQPVLKTKQTEEKVEEEVMRNLKITAEYKPVLKTECTDKQRKEEEEVMKHLKIMAENKPVEKTAFEEQIEEDDELVRQMKITAENKLVHQTEEQIEEDEVLLKQIKIMVENKPVDQTEEQIEEDEVLLKQIKIMVENKPVDQTAVSFIFGIEENDELLKQIKIMAENKPLDQTEEHIEEDDELLKQIKIMAENKPVDQTEVSIIFGIEEDDELLKQIKIMAENKLVDLTEEQIEEDDELLKQMKIMAENKLVDQTDGKIEEDDELSKQIKIMADNKPVDHTAKCSEEFVQHNADEWIHHDIVEDLDGLQLMMKLREEFGITTKPTIVVTGHCCSRLRSGLAKPSKAVAKYTPSTSGNEDSITIEDEINDPSTGTDITDIQIQLDQAQDSISIDDDHNDLLAVTDDEIEQGQVEVIISEEEPSPTDEDIINTELQPLIDILQCIYGDYPIETIELTETNKQKGATSIISLLEDFSDETMADELLMQSDPNNLASKNITGLTHENAEQNEHGQNLPYYVDEESLLMHRCKLLLFNLQEYDREKALLIACSSGDIEIACILISSGTHVDTKDEHGFTSLMLAVINDERYVVKYLLSKYANIEVESNIIHDTPLILACATGHYEIVKLLLEFGADVEHRNRADFTPLIVAASKGHTDIMDLLIKYKATLNSNQGYHRGFTPILLASLFNKRDALLHLIAAGASPDLCSVGNRRTPLIASCVNRQYQSINILLNAKCDIEQRSIDGYTPFMIAADLGDVKLGKLLIERGADINAKPKYPIGETALTIAAEKGRLSFVEWIVNLPIDLTMTNVNGSTAVFKAAVVGRLDILKVLHAAGASLSMHNMKMITPLMAAVISGHTEIVKWFTSTTDEIPDKVKLSKHLANLKNIPASVSLCLKILEDKLLALKQKADEASNALLKEIGEMPLDQQLQNKTDSRRKKGQRKC